MGSGNSRPLAPHVAAALAGVGLDDDGVDLFGLIVSHSLDGDRKVGRMHRL